MTWFNKQSRLVQIILLLIPGVNWITEILVRWKRRYRAFDNQHNRHYFRLSIRLDRFGVGVTV